MKKEMRALKKSPYFTVLPFTFATNAEKSGLPAMAAIRGVRDVLHKRGDHRPERSTDDYRYRQVNHISTKDELLESVQHCVSSFVRRTLPSSDLKPPPSRLPRLTHSTGNVSGCEDCRVPMTHSSGKCWSWRRTASLASELSLFSYALL